MSSRTRLDHLDGIRGLAAFCVFIAHCIEMLSLQGTASLLSQAAEKIKWLAVPAVDMFFVLSGFCLMYSLERRSLNMLRVSQFLTKRILRIYPTYLTALLFALVCKQLLYHPGSLSSMSEWFRRFWSGQFTFQDMTDHFILILPFNSSKLNPVIWTLSVEMQMSLVFPLIAWMLGPKAGRTSGLALVAICIATLIVPAAAMSYFPLFAIGAAIAKYRRPLIARLPASLMLSLLLSATPGVLLIVIRSTAYPSVMAQARFVHLAIGIVSAYMILLTASQPRLGDCLQTGPILFLGRVSYSFYLLHFPVLLTTASLLGGRVPVPVIWAVALVVSLTLAHASYKHIEATSQRVGHLLAGRLEMLAVAREAAY